MANVALVVGALVLFGTILARTTVRTLETELDRRAQAEAQLVARQADGVIRSVEDCANTIVVMANQAVSEAYTEDPMTVSTRTQLDNQLAFALGVFPNVANAWIVFPSGAVIGHGRVAAEPESVALFARRALPFDEPMGPTRLDQRRSAQVGGSVLLIAKRMINIDSGNPLAALVLAVDELSFSRVLAQTKGDFAARFRIVGSENTTVVDPSSRGSIVDDQLPYREFEAPVARVGWRVVSRVWEHAIRSHTRQIVIVHIAMVALASAAASGVALLVARTVTHPLESLERQMREVDIQAGVGSIAAPGVSEIAHVASGANQLLERVHALVARIAAEEQERQRYRFELLQAQIKPHFLYNALETIHVLGETGRSRRAQRALRALSEFYRLSLADGNELVSLRTELDLTDHYLFVQHLRYHDQFRYSIRGREDATADVSLPKLTLQPLVENAIYHGIKGLSRECIIEVSAERDEAGRWVLTVRDDGRGMAEERLAELRELRRESSFGFRSTIQRLRLHLGDEVEYSVESATGRGTTVVLRLVAT